MISDLERDAITEDDDGRARRAKILAGIAVAIVIAAVAFFLVKDRGNADRLSQLETDLHESFNGTNRSDLPFVDLEDSLPTDRLTTNGGVEPNLVSRDGDTIQARYGYEFMGSRTCIRVSWSPVDVLFERGEGSQCTGLILN